MNNKYTAVTDTIVEALNIIDNFESKMEMFREKYPQYNYIISLHGIDEQWQVSFNIKNEN